MESLNTTRYDFVDEMKGIAIFFVVMGHVIFFSMNNPQKNFCLEWISSFHMPLFIFISGFLVREIPSFKKLLNKTKKFMLPFLLWGVLWALYIGSDVKGLAYETSKYGYWYFVVLTLFYWTLFPLCINTFDTKWKELLYFVFIQAIFLIGKIQVEPSNDLLSFIHCFNLFPFFVFGYFVRKYYVTTIQKWIGNSSAGGGIFVMLFVVLTILLIIFNGFPFSNYIMGISGILFFLTLCIRDEMNGVLRRLLKRIGKHTLSIYALHYFIVWQINLKYVAELLLGSNNYLLFVTVLILTSAFVIIVVMCIKNILAQCRLINDFI